MITSDKEFIGWLNEHPNEAGIEHYSPDYPFTEYEGDDFYSVLILMPDPIPVEEMDRRLAYFVQGRFNGEYYGLLTYRDTEVGRVYNAFVDSTKSRCDDGPPIEELWGFLLLGSDIRKTNRSGPNTAGTRAIEGLGDRKFFIAVR